MKGWPRRKAHFAWYIGRVGAGKEVGHMNKSTFWKFYGFQAHEGFSGRNNGFTEQQHLDQTLSTNYFA